MKALLYIWKWRTFRDWSDRGCRWVSKAVSDREDLALLSCLLQLWAALSSCCCCLSISIWRSKIQVNKLTQATTHTALVLSMWWSLWWFILTHPRHSCSEAALEDALRVRCLAVTVQLTTLEKLPDALRSTGRCYPRTIWCQWGFCIHDKMWSERKLLCLLQISEEMGRTHFLIHFWQLWKQNDTKASIFKNRDIFLAFHFNNMYYLWEVPHESCASEW